MNTEQYKNEEEVADGIIANSVLWENMFEVFGRIIATELINSWDKELFIISHG